MDTVTHGLLGWALAEAGPARKWGRAATLTMVAASVFPDAEWERVPSTRDGRVFLWFARFPVARRTGEALILSDARFHLPAGWPQRHPFDLVLDGQGPRFASADDR